MNKEEIIKILYNWSISIDDQPINKDLVIQESSFDGVAEDIIKLCNQTIE